MVTVILDMADNGVIKTLEDDSINGAGEPFVSKFLYTFEDDKDFKNRIKFLEELCLDIGLQMGNALDSKKIEIKVVAKKNKVKELEEMNKEEVKLLIEGAERVLEKYKKHYKKL